MYKFFLATRYLRTRFIALASVISVMLGVATMIIVNSVMTGFSTQMRERIHATLGDIIVETHTMNGTDNPKQLLSEIERLAGEHILAITPSVEIYGMMSYKYLGSEVSQPVTLVGIEPDSKDMVSPIKKYLLSRQQIKKDGVVIQEPLRDPDGPLDWDLSEQAKGTRSSWLAARRMEELSKRFYSSDSTHSTHDTTNEFDLHDLETIPEENVASTSVMVDPFAPSASSSASTETDIEAPLRARLWVGANLISFPQADAETGDVTTMFVAHPGQDVVLTTIKTGQPEPASFRATIVDVFKSGMSEYDSQLVFCNLEELQYVRGMLTGPDLTKPRENLDWKNGAINMFQIKLKDYKDSKMVVRKLQQGLDYHFSVKTWEDKQGPLLQAVAVESAILNVLLFLIVTVAGFGILAIFYMIVIEKTRDIGIMKALGASSGGVMSIFMFYGLALGIVGSGVGVVSGLVFIYYINEIEKFLSRIIGTKVFDETVYYFHVIPTVVHPMMVFWVAMGAMLIAILASVLPSRRAAALHPVRALRYE